MRKNSYRNLETRISGSEASSHKHTVSHNPYHPDKSAPNCPSTTSRQFPKNKTLYLIDPKTLFFQLALKGQTADHRKPRTIHPHQIHHIFHSPK